MQATGGGHKEASFNVDEFSHEFADLLHTVPADDGHVENYRLTERYDQSRVWTCEVKQWSRRQSRATREANQATEAPGEGRGHSSSPDTKNPDKLLDSLLAKDPVWRDVIAHRKQKGANRPVTDEEREALGTRAELHIIGYSAPFYKILNKGEIEEGYQLRQVEGLKGGGVPPWFPDLMGVSGVHHRRGIRGVQRRLSPGETGPGLFQPGALPGEAAGRPGGVPGAAVRGAEGHRSPGRPRHPGPQGSAAVGPGLDQVPAGASAAVRDARYAGLAPSGIPPRRLLLRKRRHGPR